MRYGRSPTTSARFAAPDDRARVVDHPVERGAERVGRAVDDHLERVADEEEVDARGVEERGRRGVVGGEGRDLPAPLERAKARSREARGVGRQRLGARGSRRQARGLSLGHGNLPHGRRRAGQEPARAAVGRAFLSAGVGRPSRDRPLRRVRPFSRLPCPPSRSLAGSARHVELGTAERPGDLADQVLQILLPFHEVDLVRVHHEERGLPVVVEEVVVGLGELLEVVGRDRLLERRGRAS